MRGGPLYFHRGPLKPGQAGARVLGIEPRQFLQNLLRALVRDPGHDDSNLHDLAALTLSPQRRSALPPQPKLLPALGPRRDAQQRLSIDRRDLDLRAQRRLGDRDRQRAVDIVPLATEELVRADRDDEVEIAVATAQPPAVPLARDPHPVPRVDTGRNPHGQGLTDRGPPAPAAHGALVPRPARSDAGAARAGETHDAVRFHLLARAVAGRADLLSFRAVLARSLARGAGVVAVDREWG